MDGSGNIFWTYIMWTYNYYPSFDISVRQSRPNEAHTPGSGVDSNGDAQPQLSGGQLLRQLWHVPELPGAVQGRLQQAAEGGQVRSVWSEDNHRNVSCHHVTGMFTTPATDQCHLCQGGEIGFHFKTFSEDLDSDCDQKKKLYWGVSVYYKVIFWILHQEQGVTQLTGRIARSVTLSACDFFSIFLNLEYHIK